MPKPVEHRQTDTRLVSDGCCDLVPGSAFSIITTTKKGSRARPAAVNGCQLENAKSVHHHSDRPRDVVARFVQEDGQDFVQITAHRNSVIGSSIAGELTVRRKIGTEDFHAINVVIKLQSAISISPESIRLVKSGANGSFEGKAILRVRTSPKAAHERTGEREPETSVPSVELMVDGKPAKVTVKRLGKSEIYSLIVRYDGQVPTDLGQSISAKWGVRANGRETKIDTFAYLQD